MHKEKSHPASALPVSPAHFVAFNPRARIEIRPLISHFAIRILQVLALFVLTHNNTHAAIEDGIPDAPLAKEFAEQVDRRLDVPGSEERRYAAYLDSALSAAGHADFPPQYVVLVDRSPVIQAAFIYWRSPARQWRLIGASPVSTGLPGTFDHFVTPLGVFEHTTANMDFRAEGTRNDLGVRGYGVRGMRVYDFGWVMADRGWGTPGKSAMRLQMHATDPDLLEPRLGLPRSKGCIRIPASLNIFIDHYGLLDLDYERAVNDGQHLWVLSADRVANPWAGRYLIVIDSMSNIRPTWVQWRPHSLDGDPPSAAATTTPSSAC